MLAQQLAQRRRAHAGLVFQALLHLQELGRVLQAHADIAPHQAERRRQQERQAPAPFMQGFAAEQFVQYGHERRTKQQPRCRAGRHDTGVQATPAGRRVFGQERRSTGVLARRRKTLHQADQQQQRRRPQTDLRITRQQADAEGRYRHDQDRPRQCVAPTMAVAKVPPDDTA